MKKIFILILFFFLNIIPASAWGPHTHTLITEKLFENQDNEIIRSCTQYKSAFLAGAEMPDITIVYYYSEGGKNYRLTHNWNFQQEVMNQAQNKDEVCFAYGIASHLIADGIAHDELVPSKIKNLLLPNWIAHPLIEKKYDSLIIKTYPELINKTPHMLDAMYGDKGNRYFTMIEKAIGDNPAINVRSDTLKLSYALGSFYETAYKPTGSSWMFKIYPAIDGITNTVQPFVLESSLGDMHYWFSKSLQQTANVFNNWGTRYNISPHGFDELTSADKDVSISIYLILFILVIVIPFIIAYVKKQFLWILLSPLFIVIITSVIYILM